MLGHLYLKGQNGPLMFGYDKDQKKFNKFIFLVKLNLFLDIMIPTFSIVAIAIFSAGLITVLTLCRVYRNQVKKRIKYQKLY